MRGVGGRDRGQRRGGRPGRGRPTLTHASPPPHSSRTVRPRRLRTPSAVTELLATSPSLETFQADASPSPAPPSPVGPVRRRAADRPRRRGPPSARPRGAPPGVDRAAAADARAVAAARAATAAWADAHAKARRAAALVAAAAPAAIPPRLPAFTPAGYTSPLSLHIVNDAFAARASHPLVGARLSVFSAADGAFFRATVRELGPALGAPAAALLQYDDGKAEVADLTDRRFRLLTPRAASAGCGAGVLVAALALGAEGVRLDAETSPPPPGAGPLAGPETARRGAALLLRSPAAAGGWVRADVVGLAARGAPAALASRRVRVLYEDGEDEWIDLEAEARAGAAHSARAVPPLAAGLTPGVLPPSGADAVGWRVAPYFDADASFYAATVVSWDRDAEEHTLAYDGGGAERVRLSSDVVKWLAPPAAAPPCSGPVPCLPHTLPATAPIAIAGALVGPAAHSAPAAPTGGVDWAAAAAADAEGLAALLWPGADTPPTHPPPADICWDVVSPDAAASGVAALKLVGPSSPPADGGDAVSGCSTASGAPATPRSTLRHLPSSPDVTSPESSAHGGNAALAALLPGARTAALVGGRVHGGLDTASLFGDALCPLGLADVVALGW